MAAGIRNRKDPDFGTTDLWVLDEIQQVCAAAGFADPISDYKSRQKLAAEKGG